MCSRLGPLSTDFGRFLPRRQVPPRKTEYPPTLKKNEDAVLVFPLVFGDFFQTIILLFEQGPGFGCPYKPGRFFPVLLHLRESPSSQKEFPFPEPLVLYFKPSLTTIFSLVHFFFIFAFWILLFQSIYPERYPVSLSFFPTCELSVRSFVQNSSLPPITLRPYHLGIFFLSQEPANGYPFFIAAFWSLRWAGKRSL